MKKLIFGALGAVVLAIATLAGGASPAGASCTPASRTGVIYTSDGPVYFEYIWPECIERGIEDFLP